MKLLLIGAGNMGFAMIQGLQQYDLTVAERNREKQEKIKTSFPNVTVTDSCDNIGGYTVILAVKPQSFDTLELNDEAKGVISIMAGVPLNKIKSRLKAKKYLRAMPNIAALVQKSATALTGDEDLKEEGIKILQSIGSVFWVGSEKELDIATAIAGSAPAWMAIVAEALSDGAVNCGLKRDDSYKFIQALFEGMGEVLKVEHPAVLKEKVTSPGGTTIAGVAKLEEGGVRDSFIKAVEGAYERAKALS